MNMNPLLEKPCANSETNTSFGPQGEPPVSSLLFWCRSSFRIKKLLLLDWLEETWQDVVKDVSDVRWARAGFWFLFICWVTGLLVVAVIVPRKTSSGVSSGSACRPDGTFDLIREYSNWDINDFFQITAGFGRLSFTQVKVIDVIWDVTIGRIGQTILTYFSWKAFSVHVMESMSGPEPSPVTYDTFWTFLISQELGLIAVGGVIRDFATGKSLKSKTTRLFIILIMLFVMVWPTLASAMTGYDSNNNAWVKITSGPLVPFSSFQPVLYMIHDGSRLGLADGQIVPYCNVTAGTEKEPTASTDPSWGEAGDDKQFDRYCPADDYGLQANVSEYARTYGFYGLNDTESTMWFNKTNLAMPALNVSAFYIDSTSAYFADDEYGSVGDSYPFYGREWVDPRNGAYPFRNWSNVAYAFENEIYDYQYLIKEQNGVCQPDGTYKWGFSLLQAFMSMLLMLVWNVTVYTIWLKAHLRLSHRGMLEVPNRYKAALKLTRSIDQAFGQDGGYGMSNKAFLEHLDGALKGGRVEGEPMVAQTEFSLKRAVMSWLGRERWSSIAVGVYAAWTVGSWFIYGKGSLMALYCFQLWLWPSIIVAISVGSTTRSRLFLVLTWALLGAVTLVPVLNHYRINHFQQG